MKKQLSRLFLFAILLIPFIGRAQNEVVPTVQVIPPYSPYLTTYVDQPNKVLLTLQNTTGSTLNVKLWVRISGDNGVSVTTSANFNPSQPIVLTAFQNKLLSFNSYETRDYFDANNVDLVGITKAQLIQNQALPEGNYQICVRVLDYAAPHAPRSADGCTSFPIYYIDPPVAMQPTCGTNVLASNPQFALFSWTPPATAPGNIQYEFTLKEVPNTLNPFDVIKNNVFPIIFNTTQTANNTLVYDVSKPALTVGKKYVWRVKAIDPNNSVQFKNGGYSEACWFIYGAAAVAADNPVQNNAYKIPLVSPGNSSTMDVIKSSNTSYMSDHYSFEWKAPASQVPSLPLMAYRIRIAVVLPGQTAAQALKVDSQVTQLSQEGDPHYNYTNVSDFEAGKTYAWEVWGISNGPGGPDKYYSDQWTFKVKKTYSTYKVKGTLFYTYDLPSASTYSYKPGYESNSSKSSSMNPALAIPGVVGGVDAGGSTKPQSYPYANKKINIYKAIIIKENSSSKVSMDATPFLFLEEYLGHDAMLKGAGDWVGSTTTDGNGHFEFNSNTILGNVMDSTVNGITYHYIKVLKISVCDDANISAKANPYVNNPDEYILVDGNTKEVSKDFNARVKSYKLAVTFKELPKKDYYNKPLPTDALPKNLTMYILRKPRYFVNPSSPAAFPKNECMTAEAAGETINVNGITYDVVGKKNAVTGVACNFTDLVVNDMDYTTDQIYIYAKYANDSRIIMTPFKYRTGDWSSGTYNAASTYQASSDWELYYNGGSYNRKVTIMPDQLISTAISGNLKGRYAKTLPQGMEPNNINDFPLANTKILLKAQYVIVTGGKETPATNLPAYITTKYGSSTIYDVQWTDANGSFKFNLNVYSDSSTQSTKLGYLQKYGGGDLYRVLKVVVTNPFYYSPDNSFVVDGGYNYEVGELISNVCEVIATGRLVEEYTNAQSNWKPIANQRVKLVMYEPNSLYPKTVGDKNSVTTPTITDDAGDTYKVISETTTNSEGKFSFSRLVAHGDNSSIIDDEEFYLYVEPDEISSNNFKTPYAVPFPTGFSYGSGSLTGKFNASQPSYLPETNYEYFEAKPLLPAIRGAIHPLSNMGYTTLADAHVYCVQIPDNQMKVVGYLQDDAASMGTTFSDQVATYGIAGMKNWFGWYIFKEKITGTDGKFVFDNLPTKSWFGGNYHYMIYVEKNGFLYEARMAFGGASPKKGQQESMMLDLRLPITVRTKVVDSETGAGVNAKVIVGNNYSWAQTYSANCVMWMCDYQVDLKCPYGKVKVYIYPENMDAYMPDSAIIDVKWGENNIYTGVKSIAVRPRMHDIDMMVYDKATGKLLPYMGAQLINANVGNFKGSNCTNASGEPKMLFNHVAHATFNSTATKFEFIVYGTDANGISYVPKRINVNSNPQFYEGWNEVDVKLDRGFQLKGFVKNGTVPVAGAHVYVDEASTSTPIETYTAADGSYTLKGVPFTPGIKIYCAKSGGNFIGDYAFTSTIYSMVSKSIKLSNGVYSYNRDFKLVECTTMDISSLLGFPMEVTDLKMALNGVSTIAGNLVSLPANDVIQAVGNQTIPFSAVQVKPGTGNGPSGKPICEPVALPVNTDEYNIDVKVFNSYFGKLNGNIFLYQGILLDKETHILTSSSSDKFGNIGNTAPQTFSNGVLKGFFSVSASSFPKGAKFESSAINTWPKGAEYSDMYAAFTSDKSSPQGKNGFRVGKYNGKNLTFNLFNRYPGAEAIANKSQLKSDGLSLNTIVHTNLNYVDSPDIHVNVGDVVLKTNTVATAANGTGEIKIPLGKWSLTSTDWKCNESGGLVITNGTINTGISVPVTHMSVTYTDLIYGEAQLDNISLAGIVTLQMEPGTIKSFGFDKGIGSGAWSMVLLPAEGKNFCAKFGTLQGMTGGSVFKVASVRSYSNGYPNKIMLVNDNSDVTINQIAHFCPGSIDAGSDNIVMKGAMDFQVPFLKYADNFTMKWIKKDGQIKTEFDNPGEMTLQTKGIACKFPATPGKYLFTDGKLELSGTMVDEKDKGNYKFDVTLKRITTGTTINTTGTTNKFYYTAGNTNRGIEKVSGAMATSGSGWSNFKFEGDLFTIPAEKGIKDTEKHIAMSIKGDIVAEPGNKVGVEGAQTPFGNMSFAYDFAQGALVGSSHMETQSGDKSLSMDVEMMMGSGKWYFFGSGKVGFPADFWIKEGSAATFVGRVNSFPGTITNKFKEFSVTGNLPTVIKPNGFTGLIVAAGIKMPIPEVPQFSMNFGPFGSAGLTHEIKANITNALNFDGSPTFGFNVNGNVYLKVYAGASIGVGCVHAEGQVNVDVDINGCVSVSPVSAALSGSIWVDVSASGEAGVGCCDADCDHPWYCPCVTAGAGFCMQTSANINYNTNGQKGINFGGFSFHSSCEPHTPFPVITCGQ
jgi:TANFOR domain-containing protein